MSAARLAWPGVALTITFLDDLVAGPILVGVGVWVGGPAGIVLGVGLFTALVGALVASVIVTGPAVDPRTQERVDQAVAKASRRRMIGPHVRRVGDDHPWSTGLIAALVSPVLAALLAQLLHPHQALRRTGFIATLAYGVVFSAFYYAIGAGAATLT